MGQTLGDRRTGSLSRSTLAPMRLVLALLLALALPGSAAAALAPDRTAVLTATSAQFAWDGQTAQGAAPQQSLQGFDPESCSKEPDYYCDVTLVRLDTAPGTTAELQLDIFDFSFPLADFDLSVFHSDETGAPGEFIDNGGNLSAAGLEETVVVADAEPGFYLVTVSYYFSPGANYKGTVVARGITPAPAPAAPAPAQPARPAPAPASPGRLPLALPRRLGSARRAARTRSLALRLRASEPIEQLSLTLQDRRGRAVGGVRVGRLAAGRHTVRLRATRRLRPGRHRLTATGVAGGAKRTARRTVTLGR